MYRTRAERRDFRQRKIRHRARSIKLGHFWFYRHEGSLSKGKTHCSCPMCARKSTRFAGKSTNSRVFLDKHGKIALDRVNFESKDV